MQRKRKQIENKKNRKQNTSPTGRTMNKETNSVGMNEYVKARIRTRTRTKTYDLIDVELFCCFLSHWIEHTNELYFYN